MFDPGEPDPATWPVAGNHLFRFLRVSRLSRCQSTTGSELIELRLGVEVDVAAGVGQEAAWQNLADASSRALRALTPHTSRHGLLP